VRTPTVLLTNDDGQAAEGLLLMRTALIAAGARTLTVAPDGNRSSSGRSVTVHAEIELEVADEDPVHTVWSCSGTSVDCVRVGVLSERFPHIDVVVSGANHGVNLGDDISYSGTVQAAAEAALLNTPALAVSQAGPNPELGFRAERPAVFQHLDLVARIALRLAIDPLPEAVFLNINLPAVASTLPARVARLGRRAWTEVAVETSGDGTTFKVNPWASDPSAIFDEGSDFEAVRSGRVTITPISALSGVHDVSDAVDLSTWLDLNMTPREVVTDAR
jgi:5'-nucleotidase